MKSDSIKYRLLLICLVCIAGMVLVVANQLYFSNKIQDLNSQKGSLLNLSTSLQAIRLTEKSFLIHPLQSKVINFRDKSALLNRDLDLIQTFTQFYPNAELRLKEFQSAFESYQVAFYRLVELQTQIGLDESSGSQGRFRQAIHLLEQRFETEEQKDWQLLLLQIRRNEKDFMLRKQIPYQLKVSRLIQQLRVELRQVNSEHKSQLLTLLDNYEQGLDELFVSYTTMGLDQESGLQGELKQTAETARAQLSQLLKELQPILEHELYRIQRNSILILMVTTGLLLVILVRSFVTFQRAFANFVMFFYRCKRDYQYIDQKQLGFSEFRSLAQVANEMIDSRQKTEQELDYANKEVERLRSLHC